MRTEQESKELVESITNLMHRWFIQNNLSLGILNGEIVIADNEIGKVYRVGGKG